MMRKNVPVIGYTKKTSAKKYSEDREAPYDLTLLIIVGIIVFFGLIMLSSATAVISFKETGGSYFYLMRQILRGVLPGILCMLFAMKIRFKTLKKIAPYGLLISIVLLLLVFIPGLGFISNGVRGWISIFGITIQTSEIAKLSFIIWLSYWLANREHTIKKFTTTIIPFFLSLVLVCTLIVLQPDTGTVLIIAATALIMLYCARARIAHLIAIVFAGVILITPFIFTVRYKLLRLLTFLHLSSDVTGAGYQIRQALIALGTGSWLGVGIGQSAQKYQFLPEIESDSIFAIIGEEWGFLLSTFLILLFAAIFVRGIRIAKNSPDNFTLLLAMGITMLITLQVLINIGAMVGLLPLTGIPLPLISLGGTNMVVMLTSIGILLNISSLSSSHA